MHGRLYYERKGFTLIELLVTLTLLSVILSQALPAWNRLVDRETVVASTNRLHGLLRFSRSSAMEGGPPVVVCNHQCDGFEKTGRIIVFRDGNNNLRLDEGEKVLRQVDFKGLSRLSWNHFRGPEGVRYLPTGLLYYQNGHYLLCAGEQGRKLVMNRIGRVYVTRADKEACPP